MIRAHTGNARAGRPKALPGWVTRLRDRLKPVTYVAWSDLPEEPTTPFRARLTIPEDQKPSGMDLDEREVVRGEMKVIYEIRCLCGRRWFNPKLEHVQICPRCGRAVLLNSPERPEV